MGTAIHKTGMSSTCFQSPGQSPWPGRLLPPGDLSVENVIHIEKIKTSWQSRHS